MHRLRLRLTPLEAVPPEPTNRPARIWGRYVIRDRDGIKAASEAMWLDATTGEPLADQRADTTAPAELRDCRVVHAPIQHEIFVACWTRAQQELGLKLPPANRCTITWVDAPSHRRADGTTSYAPDTGHITIFLHAAMEGPRDKSYPTARAWLEFVSYHEAQHASDRYLHGLSLSVTDMETRANAFARRAMALALPELEKLKLQIAAEEHKAAEAKELDELKWRLKELREPAPRAWQRWGAA